MKTKQALLAEAQNFKVPDRPALPGMPDLPMPDVTAMQAEAQAATAAAVGNLSGNQARNQALPLPKGVAGAAPPEVPGGLPSGVPSQPRGSAPRGMPLDGKGGVTKGLALDGEKEGLPSSASSPRGLAAAVPVAAPKGPGSRRSTPTAPRRPQAPSADLDPEVVL